MSAIEIPGYKIIKTLGVGGQATVYLAIQQGFDREVALKVMSPALAADPTFGERFIREAKIVATLAHSRIVTVYDVGESGSFYYLAMEYMRGAELKSRIAKGMKAKDALVIIAKLAQALHFAHGKGYIHRDVKSENILFDEDNQPVLTDFGIAKASNSSTQMTQTGKLIGTPEYMSPEQCRGRKLDGRADLYSLGIILFEMLTRKVPFTGEDSVSVCIQHVTKPVPQLPARLNHLQWLIDSLLAKNPDERFQSGKVLAEKIQSFLTGASAEQTKRVTGQSRTVISEVIEQPIHEDEDIFQSQSFELNDNFQVEQRIEVAPEKKSPILLITFLLVTSIAIALGYTQKEKWLPKAQSALGVEWFPGYLVAENKSPENIADMTTEDNQLKNSQVETQAKVQPEKQNINPKEQTVTQRVEQLIQQAETLAQYSSHELTDIQQAMDLLITAKSLSPSNADVERIRDNLVSIAIEEAIQTANNNQFDSAEQWIKLVEATDKDNSKLAITKQQVSSIKLMNEQKANDEMEQIKLLSDYLKASEKALAAGKLSYPKDASAVHFMSLANSISPNDPRIEQGYNRIEARYVRMINTMVDKRDFAKAESYLASVKSFPYNKVDLNVLTNKIASSKKRHLAYRKEQAKIAAVASQKKQAEIERQQKLADPLVQMRLQSGLQAASDLKGTNNLVLPIGNNALEKYRSVLEIDPMNALAVNGVKEIETTIITNLDVALSNSIKKSASEWLSKLRVFDPEHAGLNEYQLRFDELSLAEELLENNQVESEIQSSIEGPENNSMESISESSDINASEVNQADNTLKAPMDSIEQKSVVESIETSDELGDTNTLTEDPPKKEPDPR